MVQELGSSRGDQFSLEGRTAIITGAASGMGRAAAVLFAARGAHVVVVDVDESLAQETVAEIEGGGGSGEACVLDLTDAAALEGFFEHVEANHKVVDVLYNHAGMPGPLALEFDAASWTQCLTLNLWVPMVTTQRLLPLLRRSPSASIIFTASVSGLIASPYRPTYAASKGGVVQFMKSLAAALGPEGIRANAICPGSTRTPLLAKDLGGGDDEMRSSLEELIQSVPLRRAGEPSEVAHVALFLASDASKYLTGVAIPVDGGLVAT